MEETRRIVVWQKDYYDGSRWRYGRVVQVGLHKLAFEAAERRDAMNEPVWEPVEVILAFCLESAKLIREPVIEESKSVPVRAIRE